MKLVSVLIAALFLLAPAAGCDKKADAPADKKAAAADKGDKAAPVDKGDKAAPADKAANTTTKVGLETGGKALGGEKVKLDKLKFGGAGYDAAFNEALDSWTVEKWTPNADGGNDQILTVYIYAWDADEWPTDAAKFGDKLKTKGFLDMGSVWTVDKTEAFEGGWVVTGVSDDGEDKEVAFAVRIDKLNALCRGYVKTIVAEADRAKVRDEAIAACRASKL